MLYTLDYKTWDESILKEDARSATEALEKGQILYLPQLPFKVLQKEKRLLVPSVLEGKSKNVSYDPLTGELKRTTCQGEKAELMKNMMSRFAEQTHLLLRELFPHYQTGLIQGRTSFRPVEVKGRKSSDVKDDTRLHVDAFPATPNAGKRIIRVFSNVNPYNQSRHWNIGQPFEQVVQHFLPRFRSPLKGTRKLMSWLKMTKSYRTLYDHYMLMLHDQMKLDSAYQNKASSMSVQFPSGTTWIVLTDQVSHAALRGQFILEQTFYLPIECMLDPKQSPLRVLEKALGKSLLDVA